MHWSEPLANSVLPHWQLWLLRRSCSHTKQVANMYFSAEPLPEQAEEVVFGIKCTTILMSHKVKQQNPQIAARKKRRPRWAKFPQFNRWRESGVTGAMPNGPSAVRALAMPSFEKRHEIEYCTPVIPRLNCSQWKTIWSILALTRSRYKTCCLFCDRCNWGCKKLEGRSSFIITPNRQIAFVKWSQFRRRRIPRRKLVAAWRKACRLTVTTATT